MKRKIEKLNSKIYKNLQKSTKIENDILVHGPFFKLQKLKNQQQQNKTNNADAMNYSY